MDWDDDGWTLSDEAEPRGISALPPFLRFATMRQR
jgi:hypothetical protein